MGLLFYVSATLCVIIIGTVSLATKDGIKEVSERGEYGRASVPVAWKSSHSSIYWPVMHRQQSQTQFSQYSFQPHQLVAPPEVWVQNMEDNYRLLDELTEVDGADTPLQRARHAYG